MINPTIQRTIFNSKNQIQSKGSEIALGICDYVPSALRNKNPLNILLRGKFQIISETILWNEYYSKTLLKQILQFNRQFDGQNTQIGKKQSFETYAKIADKVYKLKDLVEWNSSIRAGYVKKLALGQRLTIESFSKTGTIKSCNIDINNHPENHHYDIIFEVGLRKKEQLKEIKNQTASKKKFSSSKVSRQSVSSLKKDSDKQNKSFKSIEKPRPSNFSSQLMKSSIIHSKFQSQSKEAQRIRKMSYNVSESLKAPIQSVFEVEQQPITQNAQNTHKKEKVFHKILENKEIKTLALREEIKAQQNQYEKYIGQIQNEHQRQLDKIKHEVKAVLKQYAQEKEEYIKENEYLKKKVTGLEHMIESQVQKFETIVVEWEKKSKLSEKMQKQLCQTRQANKKLRQQLQTQEKQEKQTHLSLLNELNEKTNKGIEIKQKYDNLVWKMKQLFGEQIENK